MTTLDRCIENLRRWIGYRSISDLSNAAVNDDIADHLQRLGMDVEIQTVSDDAGISKTNVVARAGPMDGSRGGLAYFCHTDVVPADRWDAPGGPFDSVVDAGRVYGRGSCDMKGSAAAMIAAIGELALDRLTSPIWFVATADEEVGFAGIRHFKTHPQYQSMAAHDPVAVIGEPTRLRPMFAHKGIERIELIARGVAAHSGTDRGENANERIAPVFIELAKVAAAARADEKLHHHQFDPPHLCINFGVDNPDTAINITAAWSKIWILLRPMPGIDHDSAMQPVFDAALRHDVEIRRTGSGPPMHVDPASRHVTTIESITGAAAATVGYGTDGGDLPELSRRVVIGPGSIDQAHTDHEFIEIDQLARGIEVNRAMIETFCGPGPGGLGR